jgi:hypothetical protein
MQDSRISGEASVTQRNRGWQWSRPAWRDVVPALKHFANSQDLPHEIFIIVVSYIFIVACACNDRFLGVQPNLASRIIELSMAVLLGLEIASRIAFTQTKRRDWQFWTLLSLDSISVLTVFPQIRYVAFARVIRALVASVRLIHLLDRLARKHNNAMYLCWCFPLIIPLASFMLFVLEKQERVTPIHNYFDALGMCFAFALSLGNLRPASMMGLFICGSVFLMGIICIGVATNSLSDRYQHREEK